jgi:hypothetical protein
VAVDTEADSFHHYREKVCLVQCLGRPAPGGLLAEIGHAACGDFSSRSCESPSQFGYDIRLCHGISAWSFPDWWTR